MNLVVSLATATAVQSQAWCSIELASTGTGFSVFGYRALPSATIPSFNHAPCIVAVSSIGSKSIDINSNPNQVMFEMFLPVLALRHTAST